jgi:hypothetical protein
MNNIKQRLKEHVKKVKFDKKNHTYHINGKESISVTTLIKKYVPIFDKDGKIAKNVAKRDNKSIKEIQDMWKNKGEESSDRGTIIHKLAEDIMSDKPVELITEYINIMNYLGKLRDQIHDNILSTEQIIIDEELLIAGTIDLMTHENGVIDLWDYKTNEKPILSTKYYGMMLYPIGNVPNNNYNKYALQLSLYKYILERQGYIVNSINLIHLREDKLEIINLPYMKTECELILKEEQQ